MKTKIGVDFHVFDGICQGSRSHILELFSEIIKALPQSEFYLFLDDVDELSSYSDVFCLKNVKIVKMPTSNPFKRICWQLPRLGKKYGIQILHTQYIVPVFSSFKNIVTIHDILFETHPQYFKLFFKFRSRILMRLSASRAEFVFTVSEYSREQIIKKYKVSPNKISVIHNGVDKSKFYPGKDGVDIITRRGLSSDGYILSVGRLEPRKNHISLIKAYACLENKHVPLVIIGQPDFGYDQVFQLIKEYGLDEGVKIFSDVKDNELPAFYRHAKMFIYPSCAEGFGMPPLEAMASGVPVISSNLTSIPEVTGDAAILVNPFDVDEILKAMTTLLEDKAMYENLKDIGLRQTAHFSWYESAQKVSEIYRTIVD